jgi:type II secretory pathway component PulF
MQNFRFSARDHTGSLKTGEISANNANEALRELAARQLKIEKLEVAATRQVAPPPGTSDKFAQPIVSQPAVVAQASVPAVAMPSQDWSTPKWKYRDVSFFAGQIAARLRAGINPAQAFMQQADLVRDPRAAAALQNIAEQVNRGGDLPEAMMRYPRMFPEYVASMVRVGQVGGFLPQAFEKVAEQTMTAHKFQRWMWIVWAVMYNLAATIPMAILAGKLIADTYKKYEDAGGSKGVMEVYFQTLKSLIVWPTGPIWLGASAAIFLVTYILNLPRLTHFRHKLGAKHRYIRGRAREENIALFLWSLEGLTRGGRSAQSAWELAALSCPNYYYRGLIAHMGKQMREGTPLSEALHKSNLFPQDYVSIVATGEYTGTTPDALKRLRDMSEENFGHQATKSRFIIGISSGLWFLIAGLCAVTIFLYFYYRVFYGYVLSGLDN